VRGATREAHLLYLPTFADYERPSEIWRERIAREARRRDLAFVDLVDELRGRPRSEVARFYESGDTEGHDWEAALSEAGNAWVADALLAQLRALPGFAPAPPAPAEAPRA
jgi:hypothetical protein